MFTAPSLVLPPLLPAFAGAAAAAAAAARSSTLKVDQTGKASGRHDIMEGLERQAVPGSCVCLNLRDHGCHVSIQQWYGAAPARVSELSSGVQPGRQQSAPPVCQEAARHVNEPNYISMETGGKSGADQNQSWNPIGASNI